MSEGDAPQFLVPPVGYINSSTPFYYPQPQITSVNPLPLEIYISPDGSDAPGVVGSVTAPFATITNAIGYVNALPGAVTSTSVVCFFVAPGTYAGAVQLTDNMFLIGATINSTIPSLPTQVVNAVIISDLVTVTGNYSNDQPILIQNIQLDGGVRVNSVFYDTALNLVNCALRTADVSPALDINPADQDVVSSVSARNCLFSTDSGDNLALVRAPDSEKTFLTFDGCQFSTYAEEGSIIEIIGSLTLNNCTLTNYQTAATLSPLIILSSGTTLTPELVITNSTLKYTDVSTVDSGGNKLAIRFNATTQPITATMTGCTASIFLGGGATDIVKNIGAATVTLRQSANSCLLDGKDIDTTNITLPAVAFLNGSPGAGVSQATYYKSALQNLTSGNTDITFDEEGAWNNDNGYITHTGGSADFTVVQGGLYQLEFNATIIAQGATWTASLLKQISIDITRSPTPEVVTIAQNASIPSNTNYAQNACSTFNLEAGDVINCRVVNTFTTATPYAQGVTNTIDLNTWFTWRYVSAAGAAPAVGVTSIAGIEGAVTFSSPDGAIGVTPNGQDLELTFNGVITLAGVNGIVTLSSPDASINITTSGTDIELEAVAPVASVGGKTGTVTFGAGSGITIDYGATNADPITINQAPPVIIQAAGTTALTAVNRNTLYILTSGTTQNFTTVALDTPETGFMWYVKNAKASGDINIEYNGMSGGVIGIAHEKTANRNSAVQIIYWDGADLFMY